MVAPLEGIKVLEVASWLAAPSCAALMADMGAEVIKVEPPSGDTYRNLYTAMLGKDFVHPCFQFDNRGKQGICINLEDEAGRETLRTLIEQTDIFLTNLTQPRLARYGLLASDIQQLAYDAPVVVGLRDGVAVRVDIGIEGVFPPHAVLHTLFSQRVD